jgi:hypothetical protein
LSALIIVSSTDLIETNKINKIKLESESAVYLSNQNKQTNFPMKQKKINKIQEKKNCNEGNKLHIVWDDENKPFLFLTQ